MKNSFCPFINGQCRKDCKFYHLSSTSDCLIFTQLDRIDEVATSTDGIYQKVKELVDTVKK
jgi:hypothetical protein